jgi:hypothetical protein
MTQNKCQHPRCHCDVPKGQKFCSDACRDLAGQKAQLRCDCGHPGCAEANEIT